MQEIQETQVRSLHGEDSLKKEWQPTPVFLPREFHRQRSLVGYTPQGHKESDTTERPTLSLLLQTLVLQAQRQVWDPTLASTRVSVFPLSTMSVRDLYLQGGLLFPWAIGKSNTFGPLNSLARFSVVLSCLYSPCCLVLLSALLYFLVLSSVGPRPASSWKGTRASGGTLSDLAFPVTSYPLLFGAMCRDWWEGQFLC